MNDNGRGALLPWLALLTIWIVWGSTYLGMNAAVETIPPFIMTATRFFCAAPLILLFALPARRKGKASATPLQYRNSAIIGVLLLLGGTGFGALAQRYLDSSFAALIVSLAPILMNLFTAMKIRKAPDARVLGALVVGLLGIGIMVGGPGSSDVSLTGIVVIGISIVLWSFGTVISRFMDTVPNAFVSSGVQMLAGGTSLLILAIPFGEFGELDISSISQRSWTGLIWLIVAGSLLAYTAYLYANRTLPIEIVSTYAYVNPIIAVILGATLADETIGPNVLIGGGVILSAVIFIVSGHITRRGPIKRMG